MSIQRLMSSGDIGNFNIGLIALDGALPSFFGVSPQITWREITDVPKLNDYPTNLNYWISIYIYFTPPTFVSEKIIEN